MDDAVLVSRALAHDQQAFAALYDRYADKLYDYARRQTGNASDAGDIVQDTFVLAIQRLHQLRDPSLVRPWLYAIARSEVHRRHRRVNRLQFTEPDEQAAMTAVDPSPDELVHQQELRQLFSDAAAGLDQSDREVLDLHLRHGLSNAEIGAALGIAERQVSVVVQRVRERLGRSIGVVLLATAPSCADLRSMQQTEGSPLTPLSRKRLARHIEGCPTCATQLASRMRPETLLAALPLAAAPAALRDSALNGMARAALEVSAPGADDGATPDTNATSPRPPKRRDLQRREPGRVWQDDGFPRPPAPRRLVALVVVGAAVLLVGVGVLVVGGGDSARRIAAGGTTEPAEKPGGTGGPDVTNDQVNDPNGGTSTSTAATLVPTTVDSTSPATVPTTTPVVTLPATNPPPTNPPATSPPPTTPPDTTPPVFQSAGAGPTQISSLHPDGESATCSPDPDATSSLVTATFTDDRGVTSVSMRVTIAGNVSTVVMQLVGISWRGTIAPVSGAGLADGSYPINVQFTARDAAANTTVTNVNGIATLFDCPIVG